MPSTAFIGVRSSWLMLARNWLLARLADWASAARCSSDCISPIRCMAMATWSATARISPRSSSENDSRFIEPNERVPITRPWFSKGRQA